MGRSLFFTCLIFTVLDVSAQSGGYSYLEFVQNKGQWDSSVIYRAELSAGYIFIKKNGFSILQNDTNDLKRIHELMHGGFQLKGQTHSVIKPAAFKGRKPTSGPGSGAADDPFLLHSHIYQVSFENSNPNVEIVPEKPFPHHNNYFSKITKNPVTNCGVFQGITYKNLYDGIDLHYYTEGGFVKYDLVVHPGADPGKIVLRYDGQKGLLLHKNQVSVQTTVGTVRELEPRSYQYGQQGRTDVSCKYVLQGNRVHFKVDHYSPDETLVIDPNEVFCTFTGSHSDNWGYTATYDNSGDLFLGGIVLDYGRLGNGNLYGATTGAFQSTYAGGDGSEGIALQGETPSGNIYYDYDIGLMKFNSKGSVRLWATYLGGAGDEQPHSMVCDPAGNLIVTGRTTSTAFGGVTLPTFGPCGGFDLFVAKLSADGSTLLGAARIGGSGSDGVNNSPKYVNQYGDGSQSLRLNYGDDGRSEVVLDASNNIYLAACTRSQDFPVVGGFQSSFGGGAQDGILLKLSPNANSLLFSSYLGGNSDDAAFALALNPTDNSIWVTGGTMSTDLKNSTGASAVLTASNNGGIDGFVAVVSNDGSTLEKTAYFGTSSTDIIYGIGFDKKGYPYVTGITYSVIPVVQSPFNAGGNQSSGKQFITKLKPDLSGIVYSANFGPGNTPYPNISTTAFLVDRCENVYVSGWGGGIDPGEGYHNSGTSGLVTTAGAFRTTTDNADFYFFVLQKNAASQLFGSFFGQVEATKTEGGQTVSSLGDHVDGGTSRFDAQGVIYQAICANCGGIAKFPTTSGAAFTANGALNNGAGCNEAGVKIAFNFAGVSAGLKVVTHGRGDSVGCTPLSVTFSDTILNAKSYIWNFGDGTILATTDYTEQHTYNAVGTYLVTLIAIDSNTCNVADTVTHTVIVKNNPAFLNFDYAKIPPCTSLSYVLTNLSSAPAGYPFSNTAFNWSFGDGTTKLNDNLTDQPTHSFPAPGPYKVTLSLNDTEYCNYPLDTTRILYVAQNVKASFTTPALGCAPYQAVFTNTSIAGQKYYWNFGDESPIDSVDVSPTHLYNNVGTYTISLIAVDSSTCNVVDSFSLTITVQGKPTAGFTYEPVPPQPPNTPTVFTDGSTPAVKYQWLFGDGTSETKTTPDTVVHLYNKTDTFRACLVVTNASGCSDTVCHPVPAVINPLLDVPNAFTPGRFGQNAIIKVVGFGITHMVWRIYNRWGQVVFESEDANIGWDGTYRGVLQPMDVYAYTLEAEYSDGSHTSKKGDITLIR